MVLDDLLSPADMNTEIDPYVELEPGSPIAEPGDFTCLGMDPNISDSELPGDVPNPVDSDSDSDSDSATAELHPVLEAPLEAPTDDFDTAEPHLVQGAPADSSPPEMEQVGDDLDQDDVPSAGNAGMPEVVRRLQKQLLNGYTHPNHPPIHDPRHRPLTEVEELSLRHYLAWVDSHGTVKAYKAHAQVLQQAKGIDILSLYLVRKLAIEVTGLSSQMVDMCPKSCMAFTGDYKGLQSCTYVRDKRFGPCGEPRYDRNHKPRAQMLYTPITPVIQSFYMDKEMAEAMRYRHRCLEKALTELDASSIPMKYSDFPDSINHIQHSHLFQNETDTAITISGDGAQLTMKKQSDVWVLVVTVLNLPPKMRSKAHNIIIPLTIPGPSSPGNVESFIYVLYEELAKLSVGVWTFDALSGQFFLLKVFLCGVLGDMLGSAKLSRMAGHMALYGCRFSMVRGARPSNKGII
jgi:hypothetical protein